MDITVRNVDQGLTVKNPDIQGHAKTVKRNITTALSMVSKMGQIVRGVEMNINKELCKALGLEGSTDWRSMTDVFIDGLFYPDFTTDAGKIQLLREMEKRGLLEDFAEVLSDKILTGYKVEAVIETYILDETGKLAELALEWLKENKPEMADDIAEYYEADPEKDKLKQALDGPL